MKKEKRYKKDLTREEAFLCLKLYKEGKTNEAWLLMEETVMKIVVSLSNKYRVNGYTKKDLQQELICRILGSINKIELDWEMGNLSLLFYTIAKRHLINEMQRADNNNNIVLNTASSLDVANKRTGKPIVEELTTACEEETGHSSALIERVFMTLAPMEQDTIRLLAQGNTYKEAGEKLGVSEKCIDNTRTRAKKKATSVKEAMDSEQLLKVNRRGNKRTNSL